MRYAIAALLVALSSGTARADLAALVPADDARNAIVIGAQGEVYEPDGKGAWARKQRVTTAKSIAVAGRAGTMVVAFGEGVVYRLAQNGWSAIRLHQKESALMSSGGLNTIAAVGRQLFALDRSAGGEPAKLAVAPNAVTAIASGATGALVQTASGVFRLDGAKLVAVKNAPRQIARLVSDRWVLVDGGAMDLRTGRKTGVPPNVTVALAAPIVGAPERLALVATARGGKLELVTIAQQIVREPIDAAPADAAPVAVVVDKAGRAVIALGDGQLLVRDSGAWSITRVVEALPTAKPGAPPAVSR